MALEAVVVSPGLMTVSLLVVDMVANTIATMLQPAALAVVASTMAAQVHLDKVGMGGVDIPLPTPSLILVEEEEGHQRLAATERVGLAVAAEMD